MGDVSNVLAMVTRPQIGYAAYAVSLLSIIMVNVFNDQLRAIKGPSKGQQVAIKLIVKQVGI